jgi:hypothetical protein
MLVGLFPVTVTVQCSLIETRRVDGKLQQEHVASLGTIEIPPSIADRIATSGLASFPTGLATRHTAG